MPFGKGKKKDEDRRPSRLLNLNKSPRAQKLLAKTNAATSPLLLLPPEIRCRIYDFAFGDMIVRVGYRQQTVCQSSQACELQRSQRCDRRISYYTAKPTTKSDDSEFMDCQTHIHSQLPVHLLRVCRQIYHEAVLKPFSQPTFDLGEGIVLHWGVGSFMARLVPVQARAIAQIRLTGISRLNRRPKIPNSQLRGLKYVEVQFFMRTDDFYNDIPLNELSSFRLEGTVERLRKLGLKSMRFTMLIKGDAPTDRDKALIL